MDTKGDPHVTLPANTQRIATVFEGIIRRYPDQWFNYVPIWKEKAPETENKLL